MRGGIKNLFLHSDRVIKLWQNLVEMVEPKSFSVQVLDTSSPEYISQVDSTKFHGRSSELTDLILRTLSQQYHKISGKSKAPPWSGAFTIN